MYQQSSKRRKSVTVSRIQRDGTIDRCGHGRKITPKEMGPGKSFVCDLAGSIQLHRALSRPQASIERIWKFVETEVILICVNNRQASPEVRISREFLDRLFQGCADFCMLFRRELRPVTKEAEYKFIRR